MGRGLPGTEGRIYYDFSSGQRSPQVLEEPLLHGEAHSYFGSYFLPQVDNKGRNFLHVAVQNSDIESVLFLISVQANVNSRVQDASKLTPLHLAVQAGSEIIVRNLVSVPETLPETCRQSMW